MRSLRILWHKNRLLVLAFAVALALTGFFAVRFCVDWLDWKQPAMRDQPIQGWMTPRYVAMSWQVPREVMLDALDLPADPPRGGKPASLAVIAATRDEDTQALISQLEAAIAAFRASEGTGAE